MAAAASEGRGVARVRGGGRGRRHEEGAHRPLRPRRGVGYLLQGRLHRPGPGGARRQKFGGGPDVGSRARRRAVERRRERRRAVEPGGERTREPGGGFDDGGDRDDGADRDRDGDRDRRPTEAVEASAAAEARAAALRLPAPRRSLLPGGGRPRFRRGTPPVPAASVFVRGWSFLGAPLFLGAPRPRRAAAGVFPLRRELRELRRLRIRWTRRSSRRWRRAGRELPGRAGAVPSRRKLSGRDSAFSSFQDSLFERPSRCTFGSCTSRTSACRRTSS